MKIVPVGAELFLADRQTDRHDEIIRIVQPTRCNFSQFIYFCKTLCMFQTGFFPSVIRSSKLHIQRQVLVWQIPDAVCAVLSS